MNKKIALYLLGLFMTAAFLSCDKDTGSSTDFFPEVQVNTNVNLLLPQYSSLSLAQGYVYLPEGYRGIVLYRTPTDEFVAYDRTCPHNTTAPCSFVSVDSSLLYFKCGQYTGPNGSFVECCASRFDASTGTVIANPATRGLKPYYCKRTDNMVYISNVPF